MSNKNKSTSKWKEYDYVISEAVRNNPGKGYSDLAKLVLGPQYEYRDVDLLRTYIRRNFGKLRTTGLKVPNNINVLVFDLETSPMLGWVWNAWKQNIGISQLAQDWFMLTWSAKWLFEDEVLHDRLTPEEVSKQEDGRIMQSLWELVEKADVVIAHNAKRFDVKRMNTRFLANGITPPMPYQVIDTLEHARKKFAIAHNRLDYLGKFLGVGRKMETGGFELWSQCMMGDEESLEKMDVYCQGDVLLLEEVYLKLRPWIQPHPNIGLYIEDDVQSCPSCGSLDISYNGHYTTSVNTYNAFRCNSCGSIGRSRKTSTTNNTLLTASTPR